MNIIYENQRRSASNDPFARAVLWLLCFVSSCEKCQYSEFFLSAFSRISTEYFEIVPSLRILSKCRKIQIRKTPNTETFHAVCVLTCASVYCSIPIYTVTTLEVIQRKTANTARYARLY